MRPAGVKISTKIDPNLLAEGKRLWNDKSLSSNGLACGSCHKDNAALNATFAQAYPHKVAMPKQMAGVNKVYADEMAQFCMVVPMQGKAMAWDSRQLKALTTYTIALQRSFNPCAAKKAGGGACTRVIPAQRRKLAIPVIPVQRRRLAIPVILALPKRTPAILVIRAIPARPRKKQVREYQPL